MKLIRILFFILILITKNSSGQLSLSYQQLKSQLTKIELVNIQPTEIKRKVGKFRSIKFKSQNSIITNSGDLLINNKLISNPVKVDPTEGIEFLNLIYSDSAKNYSIRCYQPRHGILIYGTNDTYLGFIEICFECEAIQVTKGLPLPKNLPLYIFNSLKILFRKYGFDISSQ